MSHCPFQQGRLLGRVHVVAYESDDGLVGGGPLFRFTFVREGRTLRIEHVFDGF